MRRKKPLRSKPNWERNRPHKALVGKRKSEFKRTEFKKISKARAKENAKYIKLRNAFLREHPVCGACLTRGITPGVTTQVHHHRGRRGRLLCDTRFWIAVCFPCHDFIHGNPSKARALGLLAEASEFDVYPR